MGTLKRKDSLKTSLTVQEAPFRVGFEVQEATVTTTMSQADVAVRYGITPQAMAAASAMDPTSVGVSWGITTQEATVSAAMAQAAVSRFDPDVEAFATRVEASGGTLESGIIADLFDPLIKELKAQGYYSDAIFIGAAGAREVVSGSVRTIFDASGHQFDLTQSTTSQRPTDSTSVRLNGKVVSTFDGTDDQISNSDLTTPMPVTYIQGFEFLTLDSDASDIVFSTTAGGGDRHFFWASTGNNLKVTLGELKASGVEAFENTPYLSSVVGEGGSTKVRVNDTTLFSGSSSNNSGVGFRLGAYYDGNRETNINHSVALIIGQNLSDAESRSLETIIDSYYSIY